MVQDGAPKQMPDVLLCSGKRLQPIEQEEVMSSMFTGTYDGEAFETTMMVSGVVSTATGRLKMVDASIGRFHFYGWHA